MGMDPKQKRVLEEGEASDLDLPRDTAREAVRAQEERPRGGRTTGRKGGVADIETEPEGRRTMKARREHSKGDGNLPTPDPSAQVDDERPDDRLPRDLPKSADDRSAPKGNTPAGQDERNPELEMRDDAEPERSPSGFELAERATDEVTEPRPRRRAPNARRSSAAKRDALRRSGARTGARPRAVRGATKAPKNAKKNATRAAAARSAQPGRKRMGTARRGSTAARSRSSPRAKRRRG
jgi:hypothetical protein